MRRQARQIGGGLLVVLRLAIAKLHRRARSLGELRFDRQHDVGIRGSFCCALAQKREHLCDMLAIFRANVLGIVAGSDVVAALRQTKPALPQMRDVLIALLFILRDVECKENRHACRVQMADELHQLIAIFQACDPIQFPGERLSPLLAQFGFVHRRQIKIAYLAAVFIERAAVACAQLLDDCVQRASRFSSQYFGNAPPAAVFRRDRIVLDPVAVVVLVKVVAGTDGGIEVSAVDAAAEGCIGGADGERGHHCKDDAQRAQSSAGNARPT